MHASGSKTPNPARIFCSFASAAPSREADRSLPDGFLAEIMSLREELQDALASHDAAAAAKLDDWAKGRRAHHIADVSARFDALSAPATPAQLMDIRKQLNAWRYIERMLEQFAAAN